LPHRKLGLLVGHVDVDLQRLLVDVADPATEGEEVHPGEHGDRAEGMPELVVRALEAELKDSPVNGTSASVARRKSGS
jgi:hypothetical protein